MKKNTLALSLLCSFIFTQAEAENNYIECQRNKTSFKQFCKIKEQTDIVNVDIAKSFTLGSSNLNISNTLAKGAITSDSITGESLTLNSLRPLLQFKSDWNDAADCLASSLWADEIYMAIKDGDKVKGMQPSRLYPGLDSQIVNLALFTSDTFTPWRQSDDEDNIRLEAEISVFNKSYDAQRPLASERIPLDCNLMLVDASLYFDSNIISQDLATLKDRAEVIMQDLSQPLDLESESVIAAKNNLKSIMLGAFAVTAIARTQNSDYSNPQWMSSDSISSLY